MQTQNHRNQTEPILIFAHSSAYCTRIFSQWITYVICDTAMQKQTSPVCKYSRSIRHRFPIVLEFAKVRAPIMRLSDNGGRSILRNWFRIVNKIPRTRSNRRFMSVFFYVVEFWCFLYWSMVEIEIVVIDFFL